MCKYCKGYFGQTTESQCFKVNTNVEGNSFVILAKGDKKAELVISTEVGVFGIEIEKCPMCGEELNQNLTKKERY